MSDQCPVCGKGELKRHPDHGWIPASHLSCVRQKDAEFKRCLESENRCQNALALAEAELVEARAENQQTYETWSTTVERRAEQAEAELAALRAMLRLAWARTLFWLDSVDVPAEQPTFDDWLAELRERAR